jgi:hypothetical protein
MSVTKFGRVLIGQSVVSVAPVTCTVLPLAVKDATRDSDDTQHQRSYVDRMSKNKIWAVIGQRCLELIGGTHASFLR